jgi:hypothetical protein
MPESFEQEENSDNNNHHLLNAEIKLKFCKYISSLKIKFQILSPKQKVMIILFFVTFSFWFLLSIFNISYGLYYVNYSDKQICQLTNNSIIKISKIMPTVELNLWFIVNGIFWIISIVCSILYLLTNQKRNCEKIKNIYISIFPSIMIILISFLLVWILVGYASFFQKCQYNFTNNVKSILYFTFICEIIFILGNILWFIHNIWIICIKICAKA